MRMASNALSPWAWFSRRTCSGISNSSLTRVIQRSSRSRTRETMRAIILRRDESEGGCGKSLPQRLRESPTSTDCGASLQRPFRISLKTPETSCKPSASRMALRQMTSRRLPTASGNESVKKARINAWRILDRNPSESFARFVTFFDLTNPGMATKKFSSASSPSRRSNVHSRTPALMLAYRSLSFRCCLPIELMEKTLSTAPNMPR
ncbi:hypothetical protein BJV74DRAFT_123701 [Russula compacta]|nr:hypothetical protein BJV74DRAFT_123701 [Russula compacta]